MKTAEEILKEVISKCDYFISEDHWVWTIAIKAMEEYAKENLREEYIQFLDWNKYSTSKRIAELINFDEYLKQKQ